MHREFNSPPDDANRKVVVAESIVATIINQIEYRIHHRVLSRADRSNVPQYRVLRGDEVVKDWTDGDIARYFSQSFN